MPHRKRPNALHAGDAVAMKWNATARHRSHQEGFVGKMLITIYTSRWLTCTGCHIVIHDLDPRWPWGDIALSLK
jgi:hypothetical protein